jgi:hypothetical protein
MYYIKQQAHLSERSSARMDSRVIKLTPAAQKYGNLSISSCGKDFFPPDIFGASSQKAGLGVQITLKADGLPEPVKTDIPTHNKTGKPRWLFRERAWAKKFVKIHKLNTRDTIVITRIAPRKYLITPNGTGIAPRKYLITPDIGDSDLITLERAARIVGKTPHNIRDYIQRGRINKYDPIGNRISKARNGQLRVSLKELRDFLNLLEQDRQKHHCAGLHKELGFYGLPEYERTKHVHLHTFSLNFNVPSGGKPSP